MADAWKRLDQDAALDELELLEESAIPESAEGTCDLWDTDDDRVGVGGGMVFADQDEVLRNLLLKAAKAPLLLVLMSWFASVFIAVL